MARYRKVDVRMWGDAWFRGLTPIPPCGAGLWFYLLTGEDTGIIPGIFRSGEAGMAEALGWPLEAFREAFREVSADGKVKVDWKARVVWVRNAIRFNAPESPNVVRSWREAWDELPECALKAEAWRHLRAFCDGKGEGWAKAFREACPKPSGKGSPNQEQEQEQEEEALSPARAGAEAPTPEPAEAVTPPAADPSAGPAVATEPAPPPPPASVSTADPCPPPPAESGGMKAALRAEWDRAFPAAAALLRAAAAERIDLTRPKEPKPFSEAVVILGQEEALEVLRREHAKEPSPYAGWYTPALYRAAQAKLRRRGPAELPVPPLDAAWLAGLAPEARAAAEREWPELVHRVRHAGYQDAVPRLLEEARLGLMDRIGAEFGGREEARA